MTDAKGFDFTQFVPGFDFLKKLGSGGTTASAATPGWVAPTLDPAELDRRIQELKTVHFWLDQNTKAVSATIQALEVQRMTLSALQGMNVSLSEMADSLKIKPETFATPSFTEAAPAPEAAASSTAKASAKPSAKPAAKKKRSSAQPESQAAATSQVDPGQWWGALTQQFQNIAQTAMSEMSKNAAAHPGAPDEVKAASTTRTAPAPKTAKVSGRAPAKRKRA